jgi:hypothetical protein
LQKEGLLNNDININNNINNIKRGIWLG